MSDAVRHVCDGLHPSMSTSLPATPCGTIWFGLLAYTSPREMLRQHRKRGRGTGNCLSVDTTTVASLCTSLFPVCCIAAQFIHSRRLWTSFTPPLGFLEEFLFPNSNLPLLQIVSRL